MSRLLPLFQKLTWLIHPPRFYILTRISKDESMFLKGPSYRYYQTLDFITNSSVDFLKLLVAILTEKSADPTAIRLELGWKEIEVIGALVKFILLEVVQHCSTLLKKPRDKVLQDDPRANFLVLGAHLAVSMDNLMSILTSIFYHLVSEICLHTTTLRSWLEDINLLSEDQSTSLMV